MAYIGRAPTYGLFQTQSITADSSNTTFNLNYGVSSASSMLVSVGGVVQEPDVAYTVGTGGQTIVFSEAPETGAGVFIIYLGEKYDVPTFANSTVTTAMIADNSITSAKIANGTVIAADILDNTVTSAKLTTTGVTANTYGGNAVQTIITVDTAGRITSASNVTSTVANTNITGNIIASQITSVANTQITGNIISSQIQPTGVVAATYGNAIFVPSVVVDVDGRITSASNVSVDFVRPGVASTFTALQTFTGSTSVAALKLTNAKETCNVSATAATGNINFDVTTQSVLYYTSNATANWTVNLRGSSSSTLSSLMSTGESISVVFLVSQGATAYYNSTVQVDGVGTGVTTRWQGGTAPTSGNASSVDLYSYTVIKTGASSYTVLASQTKF